MKSSIASKLEDILLRHDEVSALLGDAEVIQDQKKFQQLSREYAQLEPVVKTYREYKQCRQTLEDAREMLKDPELAEMARDESREAEERIEALEDELQILLLPKDPNDDKNLFLEIRAGTGGDEAALFSGDLLKMYQRYAEQRGWRMELLSESAGEHGGYKEVITRIEGEGAFSRLKFESGTHRVQRVPETESQGRIHTSACTVAVLPEMDDVGEVDLNPADLRIDTYRSSGAGGQHVNTTDSAIRITHMPTGIVVECQDERSQHKNKAKAMSLLASRILEAEQEKQASQVAEDRKLQVGSGDRSQRIRTYNYPQGRVTDHRINLTLYKLQEVLAGDLDALVNPLTQEQQTQQLAALGKD